jgi:ABC-type phosphate/phosphonate transport system permease subunit
VEWLGHFVRAAIPILSQIREVGSITITGTVFGAFVGAPFAYLERRKLTEERSQRVR